QERRQSPE
nr:RecName: Full=Unknown protein from spot P9 of 2D-PAGE of heart tissue [Rattus norvegicus]